MSDENTDHEQPGAGTPHRRTAAVAAAVGVAGLVAGGLAAGTLSAASAASDDSGERSPYDVQRDGDRRPPAGEGPSGEAGEAG